MPSFRLSKDTIRRLNARFRRFARVRQLIHRNIAGYVNDFMNFQGRPDDRREFLETKYRPKAPQENYLLTREDSGKILFHIEDIALLTGRDSSSISRTLTQLESLQGWCSRLLAIREESKSANNNKIFVYGEKIFDLIIDFRETKYLERYKLHGNSDYKEVVRYWDYMKRLEEIRSQSINKFIENDSQEEINLPDLPFMSWHDVLKLIGSKLFTIRADMIFAMIFAVSFMFARKWPVLIPVFAGMSLAALSACVFMLRVRMRESELISDIGAVCALLVLFWGVNLTIENAIYTPGGTVLTLGEPEPLIVLKPVRFADSLAFMIDAENQHSIKEIFYKIDSGREYKSTGFTWSGGPNLLIEPDKQHGLINIMIKYIDNDGKEHEPSAFMFDLDKEYFETGKNLLLNEEDFIIINNFGDTTKILAVINDSVKEIAYGVNKPQPDKIYRPHKTDSKPLEAQTILTAQKVKIEYISAYIIFLDGTSSDVRITYN